MSIKALFLDKDGTLIKDANHRSDPASVEFEAGVIEGLKRIQHAGFEVIVISNQPGVAKGMYTEDDIQAVRSHITKCLAREGIRLSGYYYCPHGPADGCSCRKPSPEMFFRAAEELSIDLDQSWMIGDILDDVQAGKKAGCRTILINNGNETEWKTDCSRIPDASYCSLDEAAGFVTAGAPLPLQPAPGRTASPNFGAWQTARNVLCVRLDGMGDVIMTSPALRAVKTARRGRRVTLFTSAGGAEAARLNPYVDDIFIYNAPWMKSAETSIDDAPQKDVLKELRDRNFDAAFIFTVYSQSALPAALLCYQAGIPLRIAYSRENPYHLLTDWIPETEPHKLVRHEVQRQLDLAAAGGACSWNSRLIAQFPALSSLSVDRKLEQEGLLGKPLIIMHTGAQAPSRRYPPELYSQVAGSLVAATGCDLILTGTDPEVPVLDKIRRLSGVPCKNWGGRLDAREFAALIKKAALLISNNTSAVHLAAAACIPVVDLYALTNPQHTPWLTPNRVLFHDVPCRFCHKSICPEGHHACLDKVPPETVLHAALELLNHKTTSVSEQKEAQYADAGN